MEAKLAVIDQLGYESVGHFVQPASDWWDDYYRPMTDLLAEKSKAWANEPDGLAVIAEAQQEIDLFRQFSDYYSYAFFVMKA